MVLSGMHIALHYKQQPTHTDLLYNPLKTDIVVVLFYF